MMLALIQTLLFNDRQCSMCGGDKPDPKWLVKRGAKWRHYFWCSSECEAEMTGLLEEMGLNP